MWREAEKVDLVWRSGEELESSGLDIQWHGMAWCEEPGLARFRLVRWRSHEELMDSNDSRGGI